MSSAAKVNQKSQQDKKSPERKKLLAGLRILVVQDIGFIADALNVMLEELGCTVVANASRVGEVSLHHDISTRTGEEIVIFSLSEEPLDREVSR